MKDWKKWLLLLVIVALAATGVACGSDDSSDEDEGVFSFTPNPEWQTGDTITIQLIKERTSSEGGVPQESATSITPVEIVVIDRLDEGYVFQWTFGETQIESDQEIADFAQEISRTLVEGIRVEYETDLSGDPTRLRNWEEIQSQMEATFREAITRLSILGAMNDSEAAEALGLGESIFGSQEQVEIFAMQEVQTYHHVLGWPFPFETDNQGTYEDIIPNPFGGEPLPSIGQFEIIDYEPDAEHVTISWSQTLEPEATRKILVQTFTDLARSMGADPPGEGDIPTFTIEDTGEFLYDRESGWVLSAEVTRTVVVGSDERVERTKFVPQTE